MVEQQNRIGWKKMSNKDWSFCITTGYDDVDKLQEVVDSIRSLTIPNYEILFIGDQTGLPDGSLIGEDVTHIHFDDSVKPRWITRKKNILAQTAQYENLAMMHDYHVFDIWWYSHFLQFEQAWDICSCQQLFINGHRVPMDWSLWDKPGAGRAWALPYDNWDETQYMYLAGAFFIVKKDVMLAEPLNEDLLWNEEEDVEWSLRVRDKYRMICNGKSIVRHNKWHRHLGPEPS
jgi:hypothetical protein